MSLNLKNVDLNLLVIFEAIYTTGNISRAAERLGMSQPAVSNALARLRELVDDPLFIRTPGGVSPTAKTRQLINPVRESLGLLGRHLGKAEDLDLASYKRLFRIVMVDPLEALIMPSVVSTLTAQAPGIAIECVAGHANIFDDIRAGSVDLACFSFPIDTTDIVIKPLAQMEVVVVSRRNHPDINKPLDLETFRRLPHVALNREVRGLTNVDKGFVSGMVPRRIVYMVAKLWSVPALVERTDLVGVLPRAFVDAICSKYDLDVHEAPIHLPTQEIYLTWHVNSEHDPGHIWLREALLQAARPLLGANEGTGGKQVPPH